MAGITDHRDNSYSEYTDGRDLDTYYLLRDYL
jgi:hypothetical protein